MLVPQIPWNVEYTPERPTDRQLAFLLLPHKEALFGGAAGGGKSSCLLMAALQYVHVPGYSALILRRTLSDLKQPEALLDRANSWFSGTRATYKAEDHEWHFPTVMPNGKAGKDSVIKFGYIGDSNAKTRYQGAEFQFIGFDELGQHKLSDYQFLFSRRRQKKCPTHTDEQGVLHLDENCDICQIASGLQDVPLRTRSTANPGGLGHVWIRARFDIQPDRDPIKARKKSVRVTWTGRNSQRPFIPSFIHDNPYIDQESYIEGLQELSPVEKAQLLEGDWGASLDARFDADYINFYSTRGDFFNLNENMVRYHQLKDIFCTIDPATTSRDGPAQASINPDRPPSKTVTCAWGVTPDLNLLLLGMMRGEWEAPDVVERMVEMNRKWKPSTFVCENNGPGKPIHQFASRRGIPITSVHKHKDKVANSFNAQWRVRQGRLWLPAEDTYWKQQFIDEVFTWTGAPEQDDDIVDNFSDACNHISWDMDNMDRMNSVDEESVSTHAPMVFGAFTRNPFGASM